jgi:hypothetical protein
LCARCAARALLAHPIRAPSLNGLIARVDSLLAPSTAQVYSKKLRARHVREHGDHILSPHDPAEPVGAAGGASVELPFTRVKVLTSLLLLLLADNARDALAAAVRMRRGGANAWAAAVGRVGRVGSRRRRGADLFSSGLCVRASPWGRPPIQRVYSRESFCASTRQSVSMSVGSANMEARGHFCLGGWAHSRTIRNAPKVG